MNAYAVCLVDAQTGDDLTSFEAADVPSFGDTICFQRDVAGPLLTYEVVRVERHVTLTYGGRRQLRAIVSLESREEGHLSAGERDRVSMAEAALVARELLGHGSFDLGTLVCSFLRDRQEALVKLRSVVPSDERAGVSALLAEYLGTKGGAT